MREFAALYAALDATTKTNAKLDALRHYFAHAGSAADAAWAVYFLSGKRIKRLMKTGPLRAWAAERAGVPEWLFEACYDSVGDLAETVALLLPEPAQPKAHTLQGLVEEQLLPLRSADDAVKRETILGLWDALAPRERFVLNKLITGGFRVGVSQRLVTRAIAGVAGLDAKVIAHRMMGDWAPDAAFFERLIAADEGDANASRPYPFFLAYPLAAEPESLGPIDDWLAEWKWDGIRAQLVKRGGDAYLWTRGEELATSRYPDLQPLFDALPDGTVLDGELLAWKDGAVQPFAQLQRRIGRKRIGKKLLREVPVAFMAYDLIEWRGEDLRDAPLHERRVLLEALDEAPCLVLSPVVAADSWDALAARREESRARKVEGLMLKRRDAAYGVGRTRGDWWKWKMEPYSIDAVLLYAQRGHGRRASLYTDYTFGVWDGGELVPFAKAYSGLTDAEIRRVDQFVRRNTVERFGPVRSVRAELVFELGFEGIQRSTRHKSGIAVRFPRMLRWRDDKQPADADSLQTVRALLPPES